MPIDEILKKALVKEKEARDFYADLEASCSVTFMTDFLAKLQNEESKHIEMIQGMLGRLESGKSIT
jgi:rubrerythrin